MFKAIGFTDQDLRQPLIGVANTWIETMPCNFHLRRLSAKIKEGIREAGGTPMEFNTVAISDGVTMGTVGMRASLISREVIADSIELVARGHLFDGIVCIVGCDKTIPAAVMALARLDLPGLVFYGGSIAAGRYRDKDVTIQDVFEAVGSHAAGSMTDAEVHSLESVACPGAGACGGHFTANTMATALDFLGVSAPGLNEVPATHPGKPHAAVAAELLGSAELVASVLADVETCLLSQSEKTLFRFVRKVNCDSVSIQPADIDGLHAAGFSDEAIYYAITVCALFNFYNRWIDASGVHPMSDEAHAAGARRSAIHGYSRSSQPPPQPAGK